MVGGAGADVEADVTGGDVVVGGIVALAAAAAAAAPSHCLIRKALRPYVEAGGRPASLGSIGGEDVLMGLAAK